MGLLYNLICGILKGKIRVKNPIHFLKLRCSKNSEVTIGYNVKLKKGVILRIHSNGSLEIKDYCSIGPYTRISAENIKIGSNSRINQNSILSGNIILGESVIVSPFCSLISNKHSIHDSNNTIDANDKKYGMRKGRISLSDNIYIGAYSLLLGNTLIEKNSVINSFCFLNNVHIDSDNFVKNGSTIKIEKRR